MYVELTKKFEMVGNPELFAIQDLTVSDLELIPVALIDVKHHSLQDAEVFKTQRESCLEMYHKIDQELIKSRS